MENELKIISVIKTVLATAAAVDGCSQFIIHSPTWDDYYNFENQAFNQCSFHIYRNQSLNRLDPEDYESKPVLVVKDYEYRGITFYDSNELSGSIESIYQEMVSEFETHFKSLFKAAASKIKTRNGNYLVIDITNEFTWYETAKGEFIRMGNGKEEWDWAAEYWESKIEEHYDNGEVFEPKYTTTIKGDKRNRQRNKKISYKNRIKTGKPIKELV